MDSVALQQFLALRESAAARMTQGTATVNNKNTNVESWQAILQAKRSEMGLSAPAAQSSSSTPSVASAATRSYTSSIPQGDYQTRAEALRGQLAQGLPVRRIGNLLDVRA